MKEFYNGGENRGLCCKSCGRQNRQLNAYDWLADIPGNAQSTDLVEVQFKNTRKEFYLNSNHLQLNKGDIVAVEASPGHDIGVVSMTGKLVQLQLKKANLKQNTEFHRIYRIAKPVDMDKFRQAKAKENDTMIRSRKIAKDLGLDMKIGDVEYQGDGNKAIFYYIADGRVDFRRLIKVLAEEFHVRIEMKQIGSRQEAGHIGGYGPCGRELCCATWMRNFISVSTNSARTQNLSLNPQKLAGQCAKLKCCLNFEVETYLESMRMAPPKDVPLETKDATFYYFKADLLAGMVTYSSDKKIAANTVEIPYARAFEIIKMNRNGEKPEALSTEVAAAPVSSYQLEQESLTRFDKTRKKKRRRPDQARDRQRRDRRGNRKPMTAAGGKDTGKNEPSGNASATEKK